LITDSVSVSLFGAAALMLYETLGRVSSGLSNALQGDFGEMWLEAVAAGCGLLHGRPDRTDLDKADVQLTMLGVYRGTYNPTVKVQVKTEINLREGDDGMFSYNLDIKTYNVLRREDHMVRRVLAVIGVEAREPRVKLHPEGTLLIGRGVWVSLEGMPASPNTSSQVVKLPAANTIDHEGLKRMLTEYGVRSTTPVPDVNLWSEDPQLSGEGEQQ
jgi:hypothetical protein